MASSCSWTSSISALSHGIGSESQRPLATVIIGGLVGATLFTLFIFPLVVEKVYKHVNIKKCL